MAFSINRSALVLHSSENMFDLINNVVAYPEFLPWCSAARVVKHEEGLMWATLEVSKGAVRQKFTTRNDISRKNHIGMELVDGPFSYLKGQWQFSPLHESACKVILTLDFEMRGGFTQRAFGKLFSQVANSMVEAFCKRANEVYGIK